MVKSRIAKTSNKQQASQVSRRGHVKPIKHTSTEASDAGATLIELIISTAIGGILLISVAGLITMAIKTFSTHSTRTSNPHRITQHALARTAERMMILEECANPTGVDDHTECLERAEISFPAPAESVSSPSSPPYPDPVPAPPNPANNVDANNTLCWMVDSRDIDDSKKRPASFTNKDFRDLECWVHDSETESIAVLTHHPSQTTGDTSTQYKPTWSNDPYLSSYITNGIEALGYCTKSDGSVTSSTIKPEGTSHKADCEDTSHTWNNPWGCVEGIDTDPRSGVTDTLPTSTVVEKKCDPTTTFKNGVAVLILRVCVSMTPAELERRSNDDRKSGLTCNGKNIVVTPGRK